MYLLGIGLLGFGMGPYALALTWSYLALALCISLGLLFGRMACGFEIFAGRGCLRAINRLRGKG